MNYSDIRIEQTPSPLNIQTINSEFSKKKRQLVLVFSKNQILCYKKPFDTWHKCYA